MLKFIMPCIQPEVKKILRKIWTTFGEIDPQLHRFCADTGFCPKDQPQTMDDWDGWSVWKRERGGDSSLSDVDVDDKLQKLIEYFWDNKTHL